MDTNVYQKEAALFGEYRDNLYPFMGLAEEAGEVVGKVAKHIRKNGYFDPGLNADQALVSDLGKELGDVCWMVAECCTILGLDLGDVMKYNIEKLKDRQARGVICGSGDDR